MKNQLKKLSLAWVSLLKNKAFIQVAAKNKICYFLLIFKQDKE